MNEAIAVYFEGEKNGALVLVSFGLAVGGMAVVLFLSAAQFKPLAITLALWAVLELAVGVGLYLKTDAQVAGLVTQLRDSPDRFYAEEVPRMTRVQRNFVMLESLWLVLIASCAAISIWQKSNPSISGITLGILINASLVLSFDIIAERRGGVYLTALGERAAAK